ncbi:hypothetical protein M8C21_017670 [Ambrosia artemisiifolia]|uniref:Uncharacterized protein n=1 Tax=Ambrosia artemisiifolia TaxID=4212 RepID=A0AAD5GDT1_AMBAR|nr:hypothetical protein M8C21_017670 [Ambrosia artemisiifolia]
MATKPPSSDAYPMVVMVSVMGTATVGLRSDSDQTPKPSSWWVFDGLWWAWRQSYSGPLKAVSKFEQVAYKTEMSCFAFLPECTVLGLVTTDSSYFTWLSTLVPSKCRRLGVDASTSTQFLASSSQSLNKQLQTKERRKHESKICLGQLACLL